LEVVEAMGVTAAAAVGAAAVGAGVVGAGVEVEVEVGEGATEVMESPELQG
jgi:hypothetical protein